MQAVSRLLKQALELYVGGETGDAQTLFDDLRHYERFEADVARILDAMNVPVASVGEASMPISVVLLHRLQWLRDDRTEHPAHERLDKLGIPREEFGYRLSLRDRCGKVTDRLAKAEEVARLAQVDAACARQDASPEEKADLERLRLLNRWYLAALEAAGAPGGSQVLDGIQWLAAKAEHFRLCDEQLRAAFEVLETYFDKKGIRPGYELSSRVSWCIDELERLRKPDPWIAEKGREFLDLTGANERLNVELQDARQEAERLLLRIAPEAVPLPSLAGVLSQIQNWSIGVMASRPPTRATVCSPSS